MQGNYICKSKIVRWKNLHSKIQPWKNDVLASEIENPEHSYLSHPPFRCTRLSIRFSKFSPPIFVTIRESEAKLTSSKSHETCAPPGIIGSYSVSSCSYLLRRALMTSTSLVLGASATRDTPGRTARTTTIRVTPAHARTAAAAARSDSTTTSAPVPQVRTQF